MAEQGSTAGGKRLRHALVLGNSDGIGKAFSERLLQDGWRVTGFSRSPVEAPKDAAPDRFRHHIGSVADPGLGDRLQAILSDSGPLDLCVFCVGTAGDEGPLDFAEAEQVVRVNFNSVLHTMGQIIPQMQAQPADQRGCRGHMIVLSSMADSLRVHDAGSYSGSKAGLSNYVVSLGLYLRPRGIRITNVRFGFVDTKMARAPMRPFLMTPERAAGVLMRCVRRRPLQCSPPWPMAWLVAAIRAIQNLQIRWLSLWRS